MITATMEDDMIAIAERLGDSANRLSGKSLLVSGGNGYLAAYIIQAVLWLNDNKLANPCTVTAIARNASRPDSRIGDLRGRDDFQILSQDVLQPLPEEIHADFIIHAASRASPKDYLAAPLDTIDANVTATRNLLEQARHWQTESFLFFSSGEIYGNVPVEHAPTPETYLGAGDPIGARACYGESKRLGETLCSVYHSQYRTPVKIVRPFHIYGPGMHPDDGRIMSEFIRNRMANETITGLSDGRGVRAFCYISDATSGFLAALLSTQNGEAFNIGNDEEPLSIRDLATLIAEIKSPILDATFADSAPGHLAESPNQVIPDISKARRVLRFHPLVDMKNGIKKTIAWHLERAKIQ